MIPLGYSKIADYLDCPRKFHDKYVVPTNYDHESDKNSPALVKGNVMHESLEHYIKAVQAGREPKKLVAGAANAQKIVHTILDTYPIVEAEKQLSLDSNWNEVLCNDWWKPLNPKDEVYLRAKFDVVARDGDKATLLDWKSGKIREYQESDHGQLKLSATMIFSTDDTINEISSSYMFLEHKKTVTVKYFREDLEKMRRPFDEICSTINTTEHFDEKPSSSCRWCKSISCPLRK